VHCIKLASNENPFGPSPKAVEAIRRAAAEVNYYPDNDTSELRLRLAELHGVQPEQMLVTNGSTSLLGIMARALLGPGKNAVTSERSFIVYPIVTKATGAKFVQVPTRENGYDLEAIAAAVDRNTRLIFLANPNNPTGTMVDARAIDRFLDDLPEHVVVALDEAYSDFAGDFAERRGVEYSHGMEYVRLRKNVVVLRTFSKAHGLAGIRVGYGIGPTELMTAFNKLRTTFSVSGVAEAAALAALNDVEHTRKTVENNRAGAEWLSKQLRLLGFNPVPTWANFVFFESGDDALPLAKRIQAEGVIVRPMSTWGVPTGIRVTIGTPEQNEMFIAALSKAVERSAVVLKKTSSSRRS
jgi:histidinol-phosphate aminotransferase